MKKTLFIVALGIAGTIALLNAFHPKADALNFVASDDDVVGEDKNFGAFPPEIPAAQFDELFI